MDNSNHNEGASGSSSNMDFDLEALRKYFQDKLGLSKSESVPAVPPKLENANIESIVKYIQSAAGIPDFRSPGSGLYDNLEKYKLPHPMAIFELDYFKHRPEAFYTLAKELYPGSFKPTPCHYFLKLLHQKNLLLRHFTQKNLLLRHFTQNIDNLERIAGLPDDKLVEAHGSFHTSHCLTCRKDYSVAWMKERIFAEVIPTCEKCNGLVKPDIVFFGENLPSRYFHRVDVDFPKADLLLIMGTSLVVQPFCSLVDNAPPHCPRLLINKEKVGVGLRNPLMGLLGLSEGLGFDNENNVRDVFLEGDCDSGCQKLADMLGWGEELKQLVKEEHARIDLENEKESLALKKTKEERKAEDERKETKISEGDANKNPGEAHDRGNKVGETQDTEKLTEKTEEKVRRRPSEGEKACEEKEERLSESKLDVPAGETGESEKSSHKL
ncbi:hypothetical protein M8J76_009185 [Diaphorina citri]|nr:hypothetical protein M8J76_009185 [Diaphorina citri]